MKKLGYLLGLAIAALLLGAPLLSYATSVFITQQGGTGTTTPSGILYGQNSGTLPLLTVNIGTGLSFSGGTLSSTGATFGYPFSPITNWGITFPAGTTSRMYINTATFPSFFAVNASSSAESSTILSIGGSATTTINAAGTLAVGSAATSTFVAGVTMNDIRVALAPTFTPLTSALVLTGADGLTAEYTGATCTNQFVRVLSALGAATCATVGAADVSLANLTATDSTLTFSGTYNGSTARTIGITLSNPNTWTGLQIFSPNASSTNFTVWGNFYAPTSTSPTLTSSGQFAINTTAASSGISIHNGTAQANFYDVTPRTFTYATTTPAGTTTIPVAGSSRAMTYTAIGCNTTGGGTVNARYGTGAATSTNVVSAAGNATTMTTLSSNNTQAQGTVGYIDIGSWSQATGNQYVTCTLDRRFTN